MASLVTSHIIFGTEKLNTTTSMLLLAMPDFYKLKKLQLTNLTLLGS